MHKTQRLNILQYFHGNMNDNRERGGLLKCQIRTPTENRSERCKIQLETYLSTSSYLFSCFTHAKACISAADEDIRGARHRDNMKKPGEGGLGWIDGLGL